MVNDGSLARESTDAARSTQKIYTAPHTRRPQKIGKRAGRREAFKKSGHARGRGVLSLNAAKSWADRGQKGGSQKDLDHHNAIPIRTLSGILELHRTLLCYIVTCNTAVSGAYWPQVVRAEDMLLEP